MNVQQMARLTGRGRHRPEEEEEEEAAPGRRRRRGHRPAWQRPGILAVIVAGAVPGAIARYELGLAVTSRAGAFPLSTFLVNVSGSFVIGILLVLILERWRPNEYVRPFAATGFLGAYTTWSSFMVDTTKLLKDGHVAVAAAYVAASLVGGLVAVYAGAVIARTWPPGFRRMNREVPE